MELKTELGKHIYLYGPFSKLQISLEILEEIAEAYCVRNGFKYCESGYIEPGIAYARIGAKDETLEMHTDFQIAFKEMGYDGVLLEVDVLDSGATNG